MMQLCTPGLVPSSIDEAQIKDSPWPGIFIRGDNALHYGMQIGHFLDTVKDAPGQDAFGRMYLEGLRDLLMGCDAANFRKKP